MSLPNSLVIKGSFAFKNARVQEGRAVLQRLELGEVHKHSPFTEFTEFKTKESILFRTLKAHCLG